MQERLITEDLLNETYNQASREWYYAEGNLKQYVVHANTKEALNALHELISAVEDRFQPLFSEMELSSTLFGIVGGVLHFAGREAGLPPAYLTMMILKQKNALSQYSLGREVCNSVMEDWVKQACMLVQSMSLPECGMLVRRCIRLIHENLTEELSVEWLSAQLSVTRQHLSTEFKKELDQTLTEYINSERVALSRYYLQQQNFSITQISNLCGYTDSNYFTRVFHQVTGMTPRQYRNERITGK